MERDGFVMFVKFGEALPVIGEQIQTVSFDDKRVKGQELTIVVTEIELLEWDVKRHGINVHIQATYQVDKEGFTLIGMRNG